MPDPQVVALLAIGRIVADDRLGARFLDLSGISVQQLRESLGSLPIQLAALDFLAAHEPDLVACAAALNLAPAQLIAARDELDRNKGDDPL